MSVSLFELFKIGIGPSSSHTVGPMLAARRFLEELAQTLPLAQVDGIRVALYGSLALTGKGHGTDKALILGLAGERPESVDIDGVDARLAAVERERRLALLGRRPIGFDPGKDLLFKRRERLPGHPNAMRFEALDAGGEVLQEAVFYSVGGGFIASAAELAELPRAAAARAREVPYPFTTAAELLALCERHGLGVAELVLANEQAWREPAAIEAGIQAIHQVMAECIDRGCRTGGILPGRLGVKRRAPVLQERLEAGEAAATGPTAAMDRVSLWAIAVNEENAAGGRVVTAPTNGAAGIIPAVLRYYERYVPGADADGVRRFLLAATAVGTLFKLNASISGAEVGCQGEVGVACSMAAAGLTAACGGSNPQLENAAEIGMEHNLGLTCDPIGGLVQIPCIERNAIGAVKAISASRMAMLGDGSHMVSLDKVIATMRQTGADMKVKYKETARGGLAVNIVEC